MPAFAVSVQEDAGKSQDRASGRARVLFAGLLGGALALTIGLTVPDADAALGCDAGGPATKTWDGGAGTTAWNTAANWSNDTLPTSSDHVCIPAAAPGASVVVSTTLTVQSLDSRKPFRLSSGTLTLFSSAQPSNFGGGYTQLDGTLTGSSPRTLAGTLSWTGGTIGGTGLTTVPSGETLVASGTLFKSFSGPVQNLGTTRLLGTGEVRVASSAVITNPGLFELGDDTRLTFSGTTASKFVNTAAGRIHKISGTVSLFDVPLENDGVVRSLVGELYVSGGQAPSTTSSGSYGAEAGATAVLESNQTFAAGATLSGPGPVLLTGGTASGPLTVPTGATLRWQGGTLSGPLAATGTDLVIASGGTLVVDGFTFKTLDNRVRNDGLIQVEGDMRAGSAAALLNNGIVRMLDTSAITFGSGTPLLTNAATGVIEKVGTVDGLAVSDMPLDNDGRVSVLGGTLEWGAGSGAGLSGGKYVPAAGTTLLLTGGTHLATTGATFGGPGIVAVDGARVSGPFKVAGGRLILLSGDLHGPPSDGTATALVAGTGRLSIEGPAFKTLQGFITNSGLFDVRASVRVNSATRLLNTKTMTLHDSSGITYGSGTVVLENRSLLRKVGSVGGAATISIPVENDGNLRSEKGTLALEAGTGAGRSSEGAYGARAGQSLRLAGGTHTFGAGGRFTPGITTLVGGTVTGPAAVKSGATLRQEGGLLAGPQDGSPPVTVELGGTYRTATTDFKELTGSLLNRGTVVIEGTLRMGSRATITNEKSLDVSGPATVSVGGTAPQQIVNTATGVLRKIGPSSSTATLAVALDNDGTVTATTGALDLTAGTGAAGESAGAYGAATAGTLRFAGGTHALTSAATVVGPGRTELAEGLLSGPFTLKSGSLLVQTAGDLAGPSRDAGGSTVVELGATMLVTTNDFKMQSGVVRNLGKIIVEGHLRHDDGGLLQNAATLELRGAPWITDGGAQLIVNEGPGRILKTGATASVASVDVPVENDGLVQSQSGWLELANGSDTAVSDGEYSALAGTGLLRFTGGTHLVSPTARVTGPGRTELEAGTLSGRLTVRSGGQLTQLGGMLAAPTDGTGQILIQSGAVMTAGGSTFKQLRGQFRNNGTMVLTSSVRMEPNTKIVNASLLELRDSGALEPGSAPQSLVNQPSGLVTATTGQPAIGVKFDNQGDVVVEPTAVLTLDQPLDFTSGVLREGTWHLRGALVLPTAMTTNAAELVLEGPSAAIRTGVNDGLTGFRSNTGQLLIVDRQLEVGPPTFTNDATVDLSGGGSLSVAKYLQRAGSTTVGAGSQIAVTGGVDLNGGALRGAGTISGDLRNNGASPPVELGPGGELTVTGSYVQGAAGVLLADLGAGTGTAQRLLLGQGNATLNGVLRVRTNAGFTPIAGETYELGRFVGVSGTFTPAALDLQAPAGFEFVPYYTATSFGVRIQAES